MQVGHMPEIRLVSILASVLALSGASHLFAPGVPTAPPGELEQSSEENGYWSDCTPAPGGAISFDHGYTVYLCFEYEKNGELVHANAVDYGLDSGQSGLLYFFEKDNAEVLVKVLDACAVNGHRWVFVAPVTTLAFNLRVVENETGKVWAHGNPRGGHTASTASDLEAFPCAPADARAAEPGGNSGSPGGWGFADGEGLASVARPIVAGGAAACDPRPVTTVASGFTVEMCIEYLDGERTVAREMKDYGLGPGRSALLYAFDRDNAEVLIKVLDGCAVNGHLWVFVAPVTTLAFNLSIKRSDGSGTPWTYRNALGRPAAAKSDLKAFSCSGDDPPREPEPDPEPPGPDSEPPKPEPEPEVWPGYYRGRISGYGGAWRDLEVLLTGKGVLRSAKPDAQGRFEFRNLAAGRYAVKVQTNGYRTPPARWIESRPGLQASLAGADSLAADLPAGVALASRDRPYDLKSIPANPFVFHWEEDQSTAGTEYSANVLQDRRITFDGEPVDVVDKSSAVTLRREYNMLLVDSDEASWTQEHAWRLLTTMRAIPQKSWKPYDHSHPAPPPSRWLLTPKHVEADIRLTRSDGGVTALLSEAAFVNATPRVATVDGKRGVWFSKRLHRALVRYVTDNGRDRSAYERIFQERFGVTTQVPNYGTLTRNTTRESGSSFQRFKPSEIIVILNMLEEFPSGLRDTPGLDYLVRRRDPLDHPITPQAPAIAWVTEGYIEFMGKGFNQFDTDYIQRLVLHEKAHFLWQHVFDERTRRDWSELGGWYRQGDKWYTTKTTEFVSAYAHERDPNEDMAESIAAFIVDPDLLKSRSLAKYDFVRDRIMQGSVWISRIREDLTFKVYNLFPDYVFPGKIRRVDIRVDGGPRQDKRVRVELELHALNGALEGAVATPLRLWSEADTYFDMWLYPVDGRGREVRMSTTLVGTTTVDRRAAAGYWAPTQITLADLAGNERHQRDFDFGWKLFLRNDSEDWEPPEYVPRSAELAVGRGMVQGRSVQTLEIGWGVTENNEMRIKWGCSARVTQEEIRDNYWLDVNGDFLPASGRCRMTLPMPEYMPSATYSLDYIRFWDAASNETTVEFVGDSAVEPPARARLVTSQPDTEPPQLDLNGIEVDAEPTNPQAPNGETRVSVRFRVRDNISGFIYAALNFRDPQGVTHYVYAPRFEHESWFPDGDETRWRTFEKIHVLPPGSAPGIWGVSDMTLVDRAGNRVLHDFTEEIRFDVQGD